MQNILGRLEGWKFLVNNKKDGTLSILSILTSLEYILKKIDLPIVLGHHNRLKVYIKCCNLEDKIWNLKLELKTPTINLIIWKESWRDPVVVPRR